MECFQNANLVPGLAWDYILFGKITWWKIHKLNSSPEWHWVYFRYWLICRFHNVLIYLVQKSQRIVKKPIISWGQSVSPKTDIVPFLSKMTKKIYPTFRKYPTTRKYLTHFQEKNWNELVIIKIGIVSTNFQCTMMKWKSAFFLFFFFNQTN